MNKFFALYILTTIIIFNSCQQTKNNVSNQQAIVQPIIHVRTYSINLTDFNYLIQSTGKIKAYHDLKISSESEGVVKFYNLHNNAQVKIGTTLMVLDPKPILLKIEKVNENIYDSRLNFQSALLSQESLMKNKSKGIRDSIYRKLKVNAGLTGAELELKELQEALLKTTIKAPFSGTLANVKVQNAQYVKTGEELFSIYSNNDLYLEAKILETDINTIKIGQMSEIIPLSGFRKYQARVDEINPLVDENGLIIVKLKLLKTQALLPGMNAIATILVPTQKSLIVPKQAVTMRSGRAVIFTLVDGLAKWNYVVLGRDNGKEFEIIEGLKPGQKVVITNNMQLSDDTPVKEIE